MSSSTTRSGPDIPDAILASSIVFIVTAIICWLGSYGIFRHFQANMVLDVGSGAVASAQYFLSSAELSLPQKRIGLWPGAPSWERIEHAYLGYPAALRAIKVSTWIGCAGGILVAGWLFLLLIQPRRREYRLSGTRLVSSAKAFGRSLDAKPDGIWLHPQVRISRERETRHLLLIGGTGTGKTEIMGHPMKSALEAGDPMMIFDVKGDLTAKYLRGGAALLAPWDARGWALAIGRDVISAEHARTLAEALIPESGSDAIWGSAARTVATAAFRWCIAEKPGQWTLSDALDQLKKGDEELQEVVRRFAPEGLRLVEDARSRTTQSILITLSAHMSPIESLARAWSAIPSARTLSIREWLTTGAPQVVILQGNGELQPLSSALHSAVFRVLLASIASPTLGDSRDRRRWFFGDEFLQIGKVPQLIPLLQVARSKGVRFVLAAQDVSGVKSVYGTDGGDAVLGAAGTVIVTGSNCSATREWASKLAGTETIERLEISKSYTRSGDSETERWADVKRPVLPPDDLAAKLGQFRQGKSSVTRGLVIGGRSAVGILDWPRLNLPVVASSHKPAAWLVQPQLAFDLAVDEEKELVANDVSNAEAADAHDELTPPDSLRRRLIIRKRSE
jgi:hypothetical protein